MIDTHVDSLPISAKHSSGISNVCADEFVAQDENDNGCGTASIRSIFVLQSECFIAFFKGFGDASC